jgi:hypothetical protein
MFGGTLTTELNKANCFDRGVCPAVGESRQVGRVGSVRFLILSPALPVLTALYEDAGEEGFAGFKGRVGAGCLR